MKKIPFLSTISYSSKLALISNLKTIKKINFKKINIIACLFSLFFFSNSYYHSAFSAVRTANGLIVLYDFDEGVGSTIGDKSGVSPSLDLTIESGTVNRLTDRNGIEITSSSIIKNSAPAKLHNMLTATGGLTIEAWVEPANTAQTGPSRIISYSKDPSYRNFTLGQSATEYDLRLRLPGTNNNGIPSISTTGASVAASLQHIVVTYDGSRKKVYIDGVETGDTQSISGDFSPWDSSHQFIIANEVTGDRTWLGKIYLAAIYDRALTAAEITENYNSGSELSTPPLLSAVKAVDTTLVDVIFNEPVEQTGAETISNYAIDNGISIISAALNSDLKTVTLTTTAQVPGLIYTLTVNNVTDRAASPNPIADNTGMSFTGYEVPVRSTDGLVVLYDFDEGIGPTIADKSGISPSIDLTIESGTATRLTGRNGIEITSSSIIKNSAPAKLQNMLTATNTLTIEAWIEPANTTQTGPSRIISYSKDPSYRNFTLGQSATEYDLRLRLPGTNSNGIPSLSTTGGSVAASLQHVIVTYNGSRKKVYIDGVETGDTQSISGDFSPWDSTYQFILANEATGDRTWLGKIYLVAIYDRALTTAEITENYNSGSELSTPPTLSTVKAVNTTLVDVIFNEPVEQTGAETISNYAIDNGISIISATLSGDLKTVTLTTTAQVPGLIYTLTVNNVTDRAVLPNPIADNTGMSFTGYEVPVRSTDGLVVLYDFDEGIGPTIADKSGVSPSLDLTIESGTVNRLTDRNGIEITSSSSIRNSAPSKLHNMLTATGALTIEAWIEPANTTQGGSSPARIISYSQNGSNGNFTLGQLA